jgi:hypothetical protein
LKKCCFRNRKEDQEQNEINRASTTEFMRKIELRLKVNYLTPDKNQKKIINPLLKIDKLGEEANIQFLSKSQDKNKQSQKEGKIDGYNICEKKPIYNHNNYKEKKDVDFKNKSNKINYLNEDEIVNYNDKNKDNNDNNNEENINNLDNNDEKNKKNDINLNELVQPTNIPEIYISKCKMGEIIIKKDKNKHESDFKEKELENNKKIEKIIFLQRNIKIFLEKLKPKITKAKKTVLAIKDGKNDLIQKDNDVEKIIQNVDNIEYLNNNIKNNENINDEDTRKVSNNENDIKDNKNNKNEDIMSENSPVKENINENEIFHKPKQDREEYFSKINIIKNKIINSPLKDEMININKVPNQARNIIKNINSSSKEMKYINKKPNKAYNITNKINNKDELIYINKKPVKAYNKEKMIYTNKVPSKGNYLIKNINNNLKKEEIIYDNKIKDEEEEMIKISNKEKNNEEITSNLDIDYIRYSCPLKEITKVNYKKYTKNLEMLIKSDSPFKLVINQMKEIGMHYKYFKFDYIVQMFIQRIVKINRQYLFLKLKGKGFEKHKNYYFDVIRTYLNNKDLYINDNNDVSKLLNDTLQFYSNMYEKYKFIPYIKEDDEDKLINTQLFRHDNNSDNLISFITKYLKLEKKLTNFTDNLIKYHLNQKHIRNFNIFGITRYINSLHLIIFQTAVDINKIKKENLNLDYININNDNKEEESNNKMIENNIEINLSNYIEPKTYIRKTVNYKKANKLTMRRHVRNLSSCDINNNSYDNLPHANDSLIKKSLVE